MMFAIKFVNKLIVAVKNFLSVLLLIICKDYVLETCKRDISEDFDVIIQNKTKSKLMEKWMKDLEAYENFMESSAVRLDVLHYMSPDNIADCLHVLGYGIQRATDVDQWLTSTVRNVPREDLYYFLSDTIHLYSFMRDYIFRESYLTTLMGKPDVRNERYFG